MRYTYLIKYYFLYFHHRKEESLSVQEAIDLYTKEGAYAAMKEHVLGQIRPGYQADFIILEGDVCYNPERFLTVKVMETWVAGKRRFKISA